MGILQITLILLNLTIDQDVLLSVATITSHRFTLLAAG